MSKKIDQKNIKDWYLNSYKDFKQKLNGISDSFVEEIRKEAVDKLETLDFPTLKNEDWRYTNLSSILEQKFIPALSAKSVEVSKELVEENLYTGFDYSLLVFVNGVYNSELSNIEANDGIIVDSIKNVIKNSPEKISSYLNKKLKIENAIDALSSMYTLDGTAVIIPKGKVLNKPVQVLYLSGSKDDKVFSNTRNLFIAEENSQGSVILNYSGIEGQEYFSNVANEFYVDEHAILDVYKIQEEAENSYHIDRTEILQKSTSVFTHYSISLGGKIVRNDLNCSMDGQHSECNYNGLYLGRKDQHMDNHTFVDHSNPNCNSNELYKGILDGSSHGVFNGKIVVRQDAQKTNAFQSNKTILLSDEATIDTKPQLEIYADDVKCSHGATIGHIDEEAFFYIRSRGVSAEMASSMLIRAFANDVIETVKIEALKDQLNHKIFEHLNRVEI